ncbi:MAG: exodeoxyribonuclease III [Antricoccus sp.]
MPLTVASVNVNGIRAARQRGGVAWLAEHGADILCLQEVRADRAQLEAALGDCSLATMHIAHAPSNTAGRAGVAILSRFAPTDCRIGIGEFETDGRWIEADYLTDQGLLSVVSVYLHTGEAGTERQDVKYRFMDAMHVRMDQLAARSARGEGEAILTGDLNVAHREADLKNWRGNRGKSGFLPDERAYFDRWLGIEEPGDWVDLGRKHGGDRDGPYTWWSWQGKAFDNDTGWRIDYQLATHRLAARSVAVVVGRAPTYAQRWSDHAPVTVTFAY